MESAGVQFNPYIFTDKSEEYFVQDILVTSVSVFAVFVRAVTDNVIDMSVYIHFRKKGQIFQNGFKIFHIAVGFPASPEKILDNMDRIREQYERRPITKSKGTSQRSSWK